MKMIEGLQLTSKIISERIDTDDENYALYYLCCYGLLAKFGKQYLNLIEKVFDECEFYLGDKPVNYLIAESGIKLQVADGINAISFSSVQPGLDSQLNFILRRDTPKIYISTTNRTANQQLIIFTHEFCHIFKSLVNNVILDQEKNTVTIRRGLYLARYNKDYNIFNRSCQRHNVILDEVINVFQTADVMQYICELDRILLDDNVKTFFDKLNLINLSSPLGYNNTHKLFKPLWENETFKDSVDHRVVSGEIDDIKNNFDNILGLGKFKEFSTSFDNFYYTSSRLKEIDNFITIKKIISNYNKRTKNNGIQKVKS